MQYLNLTPETAIPMPQRLGKNAEPLMELRKMHVESKRKRANEREKSRRTSPKTAQTSPKPPVSARIAPIVSADAPSASLSSTWRKTRPPSDRCAFPGKVGASRFAA
jgi:hypothetical protein